MSAWLSAANSAAATARGQIMAETSKTQTRMLQDWQRAWTDAWFAMWFPGRRR
ncbi:hypothetical protein [Paracoccus haematequi]|nr:hypothetical protein [Paracoccus haematequi]